MCVLTIFWSVLRVVDLAYRGHAADALTGDWYSILFLLEFSLALIPALVLLAPEARNDPKTLFEMTVLIGMGGLLYRFIPTTIAFRPGAPMGYFPSLTEVLVTLGLISIRSSLTSLRSSVLRFCPHRCRSGTRQCVITKNKLNSKTSRRTWHD
jgi:Ni/Fe-hydrogenase subunit HybB-like protein